MKKKAVHYLNQFFGQVGGEDMADFEPVLHDGALGCSNIFNGVAKNVEITHTLICGDNFVASHPEEAVERCLKFLEGKSFDLFIAGPAFKAGRYGNACGLVGKAVSEKFRVPVISSMNVENPGVELFRKDIYIFKGGARATTMKPDIEAMAAFADKIAADQRLLPAAMEGYFGRGIRHQVFLADLGLEPVPACDRAVDMLLAKLNGAPFETELPIPAQDLVAIAPAIKDIRKAKIALVSSGGIVPSDNPDRIESCSATRWGKYDIAALERFPAGEYKTIHAGYDPAVANQNPNVVVPLDAIRELQKQGVLGEVDDYFYTTVGTGTTQGEAARMGQEISAVLHARGVEGVILTAT
jgi:glycine reductase